MDGAQTSLPRAPGNLHRSNPFLWSIPANFSRASIELLFHQHVKAKLLPDKRAFYYVTFRNALAFAVSSSSVSLWLPAHTYKGPVQNHRSRKEE